MTLKELISKIAERPAMYLGEATISRLEAFLVGWTLGVSAPEESATLAEFQTWIANRYKIRSSQSWAMIIRFYSFDDRSALDEALKQFDDFFESKNRLNSPSQ